jgi:hypothetical protein
MPARHRQQRIISSYLRIASCFSFAHSNNGDPYSRQAEGSRPHAIYRESCPARESEACHGVLVYAAPLQTRQKLISTGEYWIVNQILSKGLHNGDNETLQYTTTLMDKLEQVH